VATDQITVVRGGVPDVAAVLSSAAVGIVAGGTSQLESAAAGLPVVLLPRTEGEARFAAGFAARGAVISQPLERDVADAARCAVALLDDVPRRRAMSAAGRALVDGGGRRRVADLVARVARGDAIDGAS
jgi:spore coat polysaccharide biosynthesis predicted glycosyltransferase SpsG